MLEFILRCVISGGIATSLYFLSAGVVSRFWTREVSRSVAKHDIKLGMISLLFGSPVLQVFGLLSEKYHVGRVYADIGSMGWGYWLLSLPLYVLCWDLVFYLTHLVLHLPFVYRNSHFRHHSCRPPVPWSGIAIDPFCGTGTTLLAAKQLGLRSVGIDISERYLEISQKRCNGLS